VNWSGVLLGVGWGGISSFIRLPVAYRRDPVFTEILEVVLDLLLFLNFDPSLLELLLLLLHLLVVFKIDLFN
jgi:hypothetical protein